MTSPLPSELIERWFDVEDGMLVVDGVRLDDLVAHHGTPSFVYSHSALERRLAELDDCLPGEFAVHYSVKANPNQSLLRFFAERGHGFEVASAGELHQVLASGADPVDVVFAGPGKTDVDLLAAVRAGIAEIHVESLGEAERLNRIALAAGRAVPVSLRVNPAAAAQGGAMRMGGRAAPFGVDEERLEEVATALLGLAGVDLVGLHLFTGTQILDAEILVTQYRHALHVARRLVEVVGRPLRTIDFGGGLGIPYFAHEERLDLTRVRAGLRSLVEEMRRDATFRGTRLLVEPGRFLVGEAGLYVTRVIDTKQSRDKRFVVVDGGMHQHLAASGNLGQTIKRNYPIAIANRLDEPAGITADVVGPLCTPLDTLARNVSLPLVQPGDLFVIMQSGAYARAASPLGFLGHPAPPEVLVERGEARVVRFRGTHDDALRDQPCDVSAPIGELAT